MKKMLLATALTPLITGCTRTFTVQNKPAAMRKETITIISSFSGIGQKENCR